jgi:hypothetical protein
VLLAAVALFGIVTWRALEGREVALLRTRTPAGGSEETRVWVADEAGRIYLEAATPERGWYRSLHAHPEVELVRGGVVRRYRAVPEPGAEGHARIRALLRRKYGWADWWVGLLQDTSDSIAVRLDPVAG